MINPFELIKDERFTKYVGDVISNIRLERRERPIPPAGFHYKRDWHDRMTSEDVLNTDYFVKNITDIWLKKSKLNTEYRHIISHVCNTALNMILFEDMKNNKTE